MKIICTKPNSKGGYHDAGMNDRRLCGDYSTTRNFIRYGIPSDFYGNTLRLEVFYGDNIYRAPDKVMYVTVWELAQGRLRFCCRPATLHLFLRKPPMNTTNQENKELLRKILTGIAQKNFNIETLESRKMDNLDFHEVAVWQIKDALNDAFLAGMQTGMTLWELAHTP